jgi:uncharacterized protein YehS (DUF1456 family)
MARGIIFHNGAYNVWSTEWDSPIFVSGMTREMIVEYFREKQGEDGLKTLPERFEQAHKTGCDDLHLGHTLDDLINSNRAGEKHTPMPKDEFLKKFFTIEPRFLKGK